MQHRFHKLFTRTRLPAYAVFVSIVLLFVSAGPAGARYHPDWRWRTVRTDHFTIYYPEGYERFAGRVLGLTEEVYGDISGFLDTKPPRAPVVLNPGTDAFNGYFMPFPSRISLFETPPHTLGAFGPASDTMDLVFTHEYGHFAHLTMRRGIYGFVTNIIGRGLGLSNSLSPGWILEGITTVSETKFTDGGRGRSPLFRGTLESFTGDDELWGLSAAGTYPPYRPPGNRIYLAGYFMVDYLTRTYGDDAFARLAGYQAEHPFPGTSSALHHVTGVSADDFYRDFLNEFLAAAKKRRAVAEAASLPAGTVIHEEDRDSIASFYWNDRGTLTALRKGRYDTVTAILEIDPENGLLNETPVGNFNTVSPIRPIHAGSVIAGELYYHPLGGGELTTMDLTVLAPATGDRSRLTRDEHLISADVSPDGGTIVAARRNGMWIDLVLADADGSDVRHLAGGDGMLFEAPRWSPDGEIIAVAYSNGSGATIAAVDPADGTVTPLFDAEGDVHREPSFSPDGRWVVFSAERSGTANIHAWDRRTGRGCRLTAVPYAAISPGVSPDGEHLAFLSLENGRYRLAVTPFAPEQGEPWHKPSSAPRPTPREKPHHTAGQPSFTSRGIPYLRAYAPFIHVPYFQSDEAGDSAGLFLMGADPAQVNSWTADLHYGIDTDRPGYDIRLVNKSFWPQIRTRLYDRVEETNLIGGAAEFRQRERGGEVSLALPIILRTAPDQLTSSIAGGFRARRFDILDGRFRLKADRNQAVSTFMSFSLARTPDTPARDMVPRWGQRLHLAYESNAEELGSELSGHTFNGSFTQFIPCGIPRTGFSVSLAHQRQGGLLRYDSNPAVPRGYDDDDIAGGLNLSRTLLFSGNYHFPLVYPDKGVGLSFLHFNLVRGSLFVDHAAGWNGAFSGDMWRDRAVTSLGLSVVAESSVFSMVPFSFGVAAGYRTRENDMFARAIIGMDMLSQLRRSGQYSWLVPDLFGRSGVVGEIE